MRLGINWSSPRHLPVVLSLLAEGKASFCEILIDNFLHLPPAELRAVFGETPVAFHIMNSHFIERDRGELEALAGKLKTLARELKPLYISDHLALFSYEGRRLPLLLEIDYEKQAGLVMGRARMWQDMLGEAVCFENFPSMLDGGRAQPKFLESLAKETGAEVLFDFSNAVVAQKNCGLPLEPWGGIIKRSRHFHAAGYRLAGTEPELVRDSHDGELSTETLAFIRRSGAEGTLVIERDAMVEKDSWARDLGNAGAVVL